MAALTLRIAKGSPLTNVEVDDNFSSLNNSKIELGGDLGGTTSAPLVAKLQGYAISSSAPILGEVLTWAGSAWIPSGGTVNILVIDDISNQFDGIKQVFELSYNGVDVIQNTNYKHSSDLTVNINGQGAEPFVYQPTLGPWIVEYTAGRSRMFRMKDNKITFFRAPRRKTTGFIQINTVSTYAQSRPRYPFSPNTIVFGD